MPQAGFAAFFSSVAISKCRRPAMPLFLTRLLYQIEIS
jgi:hypothetical protein